MRNCHKSEMTGEDMTTKCSVVSWIGPWTESTLKTGEI